MTVGKRERGGGVRAHIILLRLDLVAVASPVALLVSSWSSSSTIITVVRHQADADMDNLWLFQAPTSVQNFDERLNKRSTESSLFHS